MNYPPDWPRCPSCGDFALDGHITCGRVECNEAACRLDEARRRALREEIDWNTDPHVRRN